MRKIIILIFVGFVSFGTASCAVFPPDSIANVPFGHTAFVPSVNESDPILFLGRTKESDKNGEYALSRLTLGFNEAVLTPLAGGADGEAGPLSGKAITNLTLVDERFPLLTIQDDATKVYVQPSSNEGDATISSEDFPDAAEKTGDNTIVGVAGGKNYIFATISESGQDFKSSENAGVALARWSATAEDKITIVNAKDLQGEGEGSPKAAKLSLLAKDSLVSFFDDGDTEEDRITKASLKSNIVAMHWDEALQRLYIGLSDVSRDNSEKKGGALGVVMGYFKKDPTTKRDVEFVLQSIVDSPSKSLFFKEEGVNNDPGKYRNIKDRIIGFYFDGKLTKNATEDALKSKNNGNDDIGVSIPHLKTMHTSTNKHYLIVSSLISTSPLKSGIFMPLSGSEGVYALPLVNDETVNASTPGKNGLIAKVKKVTRDNRGVITDKSGVVVDQTDKSKLWPEKFDEMPTKELDAVKVGEGKLPVGDLKTLFVSGDTVYIGVSGTDSKDKGIYASTAFFNEKGYIRGWTPAKRVMGAVRPVHGMGLDATTGNFYYLSDQDNTTTVTTGYVSTWGISQKALSTDDKYSLSCVLEKIFPQKNGGIVQMYSFDVANNGSKLIAVGYDKVAEIETKRNGVPLMKFSEDGGGDVGNITIHSGGDYTKIAPLCCAEMVGNVLYVGGFGGVVRNDNLDLANEPVFKIARGNGTDVYYLTYNAIHKRNADVYQVKDALDMVVAKKNNVVFGVIGTASGLKVSTQNFGSIKSVSNLSGQVIQLQYLSQEKGGVPSLPGMLYALVLGPRVIEEPDVADDECVNPSTTALPLRKALLESEYIPQLYRFAVDENGGVEAIDKFTDKDVGKAKTDGKKVKKDDPRPFLQLFDFRNSFFVDGSSIYYSTPRTIDNSDFVRVFPLSFKNSFTDELVVTQDRSITHDLDVCLDNFYVGQGLIDGGTGKRLFPGDWGVRVNE